jgi:hypothetical protein
VDATSKLLQRHGWDIARADHGGGDGTAEWLTGQGGYTAGTGRGVRVDAGLRR